MLKFFQRNLWPTALIVAGGVFGLALWIGSHQSVWFDESFSIMLAHQPLGRFMHFVAVDIHPPLYYLTLKLWMGVFGSGDVALRALSALYGGVAAFTGVLLAGRLFGRKVALIAAPFLLLSPFLLRYDFEIRMYAMASMWCVLATYLLVRALQAKTITSQRRLWGLYALTITAGAFTFYYCVFVWAAHAIWLIARARVVKQHHELAMPSDDNPSFWQRHPWLVAYGAAVILFAAWVPTVISQVTNVQGYFWIGPVSYRSVATIFTFLISYHPEWDITPWSSVFIFGGLVGATWLAVAAFTRGTLRERWNIALLCLYLFVPIGLMYLISLPPRRPVFLERYADQALMAGYILVGISAGLIWLKKGLFWHKMASVLVAVMLLLGVMQLKQVGNYNYQQLYKPQSRTISSYVHDGLRTNDLIVVDGPENYMVYAHYLPAQQMRFTYYAATLPTTGGYAMLHDSPHLIRRSATITSPRVWYVYTTGRGTRLDMNRSFKRLQGRTFDHTTVTLFRRTPS